METFLGTDAFDGRATARPRSAGFVGQADFNGCIAFCNWPAQDVAAMLPPPFVLASTAAAGEPHPVVFIFGEQTAGATIFGGLTFPMGVRYFEFALAIPFVRHRRGRNLHTFVPRMYSSNAQATWAGNTHYGLAKAMGRMCWQGSMFVLESEEESLLLHASVEPAGAWTPGADCQLENFAAMQSIFTLPVVGRRSDGSLITSFFEWDFSTGQVRAAQAWIAVDAPIAEGLAARESAALKCATFDVRRMIWRLTWPGPCHF